MMKAKLSCAVVFEPLLLICGDDGNTDPDKTMHKRDPGNHTTGVKASLSGVSRCLIDETLFLHRNNITKLSTVSSHSSDSVTRHKTDWLVDRSFQQSCKREATQH